MNEFNKFKRKVLLEHFLKMLLISLTILFTVLAIICLLGILKVINIPLWSYFVIGAGSFIVSFIVLYFAFKPNDLKIAKRIDNGLNLNAKTETMIEFKDKEGALYEIQRNDAKQILASKTLKMLPMTVGLALIIVTIVAFSLGTASTSVLVATEVAKANTADPDDPGDNPDGPGHGEEDDDALDSRYVAGIKNIIRNVNDSKISEELKNQTDDHSDENSYVDLLYKLIDQVKAVEKLQEETKMSRAAEDEELDPTLVILQKLVTDNVDDVYIALGNVNCIDKIGEAFMEANHPNVNALGQSIRQHDAKKVENSLVNACYAISNVGGEYGGYTSSIADAVSNFLKDYNTALSQSKSDKNDVVYKALVGFGTALNRLDNPTATQIELLRIEHSSTICEAVEIEGLNASMALSIEKSLKRLFGIKMEDPSSDEEKGDLYFPENEGGDNHFSSDSDEDKKDNDGGLGGDDVEYGAKSQFFDPEKGYVDYGEVLNDYYIIVYQMVKDGTISESDGEYILQYFASLRGSKN